MTHHNKRELTAAVLKAARANNTLATVTPKQLCELLSTFTNRLGDEAFTAREILEIVFAAPSGTKADRARFCKALRQLGWVATKTIKPWEYVWTHPKGLSL